ncbi:molybdenum cofactor guanylyltransferase [Fodinicola feengrottensis]|uniref:molybdenum cofactor guanylyltransferase n=1 Tax=Fodinicola feengrottensis TaxID=435914 RepID=UPI00244153E5|nr:NTP transferase domain-containing protein [Fodinicola feengrottensis]
MLAGGRSARMGRSKADLPWHGSTLLRRTVGVLARAVDGPVVVVRAAGQSLPSLPAGVEVRDDDAEGLGPLQGARGRVGGRRHGRGVCVVDGLAVPACRVRTPSARRLRRRHRWGGWP